MLDYRIISIGALSRNELWPKDAGGRSPHATTTLIRSGDATILVDPALPPQALGARLTERSGLTPADITHVFMTCFRPAHRHGLSLFKNANWLIGHIERESVGRHLLEQFQLEEDDDVKEIIRLDIELLKGCSAAEDTIAPGVDLFPLPGFTPGTCGLLINQPTQTVLVAGDAVLTQEHMESGRIARHCFDPDQAKESLLEAIEIADLIIPSHDNLIANRGRGFQ